MKKTKTTQPLVVDKQVFPDGPSVGSLTLQELPEILLHASYSQLLQAVVAVDDIILSYYDHPDSVSVFAELAANGRAHHHIQAVMAGASISVVMAREDRSHPCSDEKVLRSRILTVAKSNVYQNVNIPRCRAGARLSAGATPSGRCHTVNTFLKMSM